MAVTSEWEWTIVDRRQDPVMLYPYDIHRINWTLVRSRISNDTYVSELGDSSSSLTAKNGGILETITAPSTRIITVTGEASNTGQGQILYPTGVLSGGYPIYESDIFTRSWGGTLGILASKVYLYYDQSRPEETTCFIGLAGSGPPYISSSDQLLIDSGNNWSLPSDLTATTPTLEFTCTVDSQMYKDRSVDWYTQQQTWVARSRNMRDEL